MEVKIGIQSIPRELVIDTDASAEEVEKALTAALGAASRAGDGAGGAGEPAVFSLTTSKGGRVLVPANKIAFVEFGGDTARRLGFSS